jgi:hypothetical protein
MGNSMYNLYFADGGITFFDENTWFTPVFISGQFTGMTDTDGNVTATLYNGYPVF